MRCRGVSMAIVNQSECIYAHINHPSLAISLSLKDKTTLGEERQRKG